MYRSFTIKNFRCFDELTVEGMGRINLIAGKNNVGKTALLEALWVHSWPVNPDRAMYLDTARGNGPVIPESSMSNLFSSFDRDSVIDICARGDWGEEERRLKVSIQRSDRAQYSLENMGDGQLDTHNVASSDQLVLNYSCASKTTTAKGWLEERSDIAGAWYMAVDNVPPPEAQRGIFLFSHSQLNRHQDPNRYSRLEINGQHHRILEILQKVEPRLQRLAVVSTGKVPGIYADIGMTRLIPIRLMGDGMSRILSLALAIASAPGGMVLVDEIENGIHHSVMEKVWRAIGAFARSYDVQLFAATHSYECIGAAYRAFQEDEEDELRLFRIQRNQDGGYKAVKYDKELLGTTLEFNMGFI